jgi:hypothetical protein
MKIKLVKGVILALTFFGLVFSFASLFSGSATQAQTATYYEGKSCTTSAGQCYPTGKSILEADFICDDRRKVCVKTAEPGVTCTNFASPVFCGVNNTCDKTTGYCTKKAPTGKSNLYGSCTTDTDCLEGKCTGSVSGVKFCAPEGSASINNTTKCTDNNQCQTLTTGLVCKGGVCSKPDAKDFGETCSSDSDCGGGAVCQTVTGTNNSVLTKKCQLPTGAKCTSTASCQIGQYCNNGTCATAQKQALGAYCQNQASSGQAIAIPCNGTNLTCVNNKCVYKAGSGTSGQSCEKNTDCASNTCTNGVCAASSGGSAARNSLTTCNNAVEKGFFTQNVSNQCINCGECTICDIVNTASSVGNSLLAIAAPLAGLFLIIGGVLYTTSGGNPERAGQAKKAIAASIIGLILMLGAYLVVSTTMSAIGLQNTGTTLSPNFKCDATSWKWTGFGN